MTIRSQNRLRGEIPLPVITKADIATGYTQPRGEDQGFGGVGEELGRFRQAVRQRFGDDTVRAMLRAEGGAVEAASVRPEHRAALRDASRTVDTLQAGDSALRKEAQAEHLAHRQALGHRYGLGR